MEPHGQLLGPYAAHGIDLTVPDAAAGELARLVAARDWSATPLGPMETWPQSLRTVIRVMLTSRYAMWMGWGADLTCFYNDAYRPTLGVKHPWALGSPAREVWREIWPDIGPRIESVLRTGIPTYDEALLLFLERSGYPEETYHTFSYSPLPDDANAVGGFLCVVTEETDRIISERRLASLGSLAADLATIRSEPDVRAAVERRIGANRHDLPFTLIYLFESDGGNARLMARTGFDADHPAAPALMSAGDPESPWPVHDVLTGASRTIVHDLSRFSGLPAGAWNRAPTQALIVPLARQGQAQGQPMGLMIAGLNPYRPLDDSYGDFIGLVAGQIAAALANAYANEAERRRAEALAEIDRAKTSFFSNVSHEFRTPLTLLLGPLEDALTSGAPAIPPLRLAHRNALRLLKLVNSLLDFSRIEAGRVHAAHRPVDLSRFTAELASNFRSACDRAGLSLVVDCGPLPEPVFVDADMWEKIVLNLLSNAFKYTFDGEIRVTLRPSSDGLYAEMCVRDTGVGIPEAELPRIFDRFHRIEGQHGRTHEGSGIGLALVHELVRLHGGTITAESQPGMGAAFTVAIPFGSAHLPPEQVFDADGHAPLPGTSASYFVEEALRWIPAGDETAAADEIIHGPQHVESLPTTDLPQNGARPKVLLADDNADMRDYVARLLRPQFDVDVVGDGEAALQAARTRRPDLVLSDVMMPKLDGFGLLAGLRADPELRDIPIVLLSARAGEEARVAGIEAGADDYLVKPFSARELLARVGANVELARLRREAAEALREHTRLLTALNRTGIALAAELDLERLVQTVVDNAVDLTGAQFGAFFYNVSDEHGESYTLYTLSGAPREAFANFPMPRNTAVFGPTFRGEGVVRSADILADPRYGKNPPYYGMPAGHLPVRSYLAVPVISRNGAVLGGLFFGHSEPGVFTDRAEQIVTGIAAQAAVAIDNARLYQESRRAEEELRRLNENLEERVASEIRERLRAEEVLRQAQKMEAIGQLTGGVAHDFNNLLTVIMGGLETVQRHLNALPADSTVSRMRRAAEAASHGAQRAATLTHRLLAYSRRQALAPEPIEANKLVSGMSELLRRTLGEAISVETVLAGGLWRTLADPNQLESALLNLAVNARDAMPEGGRLTIETANAWLDEAYARHHQDDVAPGQYVLVAVSDTGIGIPEEMLDRVFEPFFTTKGIGQGTGLGLSQVYGFVKQSGGHIKIYSELGRGTTVRMYLPRAPAGQDGAREETEPPSPAGAPGQETILVVEDDSGVRGYSTEVLRELGYRVLQAPNGPAGLEVLDRHPEVRLLFTDVGLPDGMTGRQLANEALRRRPDLKVLFTTGYAQNAIVHGGILDPDVQMISKPFTYAALAHKVRQVLGGS